jgi:twitching motility protein PilT
MSLVPSLLQSIVHLDGEALVMHAGDKPYVVTPAGQVDLASRGLTLDAVNGIVSQLLPPEVLRALDEFGAAQYELPPRPDFPREQFTVVAARGGDDVWMEIRRRRVPDDDRVPDDMFGPAASTGTAGGWVAAGRAGAISRRDHASIESQMIRGSAGVLVAEQPDPGDETLLMPDAAQLWGSGEPAEAPSVPSAPPVHRHEPAAAAITPAPDPAPPRGLEMPDAGELWGADDFGAAAIEVEAAGQPGPPWRGPPAPSELVVAVVPTSQPAPLPAEDVQTPTIVAPVYRPAAGVAMVPPAVQAPSWRGMSLVAAQLWEGGKMVEPVILTIDAPEVSTAHPVLEAAATMAPEPSAVLPEPSQPAVVLPMPRTPARPHRPVHGEAAMASGLDRLLRLAAARGASTLYIASDARPWARVDGELQALDQEPILSANDVESLLLTMMPERSHEALRRGASLDWLCELEEVGRVRCMSFRDQRGQGGVFRLMASREASIDQLALWREIQSLVIEPEGLVLVAGPRWSGKRTLISAFVDLINRTRRDHVISIESEINIVHERGKSFVSQREVPGTSEDVLAAARAALREDPDVLVIEDLRNGALMNVALEAAASGHLVIGGFSAHSATETIDRIVHFYAPEARPQLQMALAEQLRGIVVQVLLRSNAGGRLPARELLLNTAAVASVIAEGKTSELAMAMENGRQQGMVTLNDSLAGFVQSGAVEVGEAYRRSADRTEFLSLLKRRGIDTSFMERIA